MTSLYPLRFFPVLRRYLWGGRRLKDKLNKLIGPGSDWAESWEVSDLGEFQSIVEAGPLAGVLLKQLVAQEGAALLGKHYPQPRFPLLLKFLDANQVLSVQVHPKGTGTPGHAGVEAGKSEAWVVLEAEPKSLIYAGLKPGVDRRTLAEAIHAGRCQDCLHTFHPSQGDCVFLPAGIVHALGGGLLVAEIQQTSDVTYRLFDWNRLGPDGRPRPLHIEQALDATDFGRGPVEPQHPHATQQEQVSHLAACEDFVLDRWRFHSPLTTRGDNRFHIVCVLDGSVKVEGDAAATPLAKGGTILLPAALGPTRLIPQGPTVLLDCYAP